MLDTVAKSPIKAKGTRDEAKTVVPCLQKAMHKVTKEHLLKLVVRRTVERFTTNFPRFSVALIPDSIVPLFMS